MTGNVKNIFDVRVPARDGIELSSDIWLPATKERYPTILIRTPYIKSLRRITPPNRDIANIFAKQGYAVVYQDVRGRGDSDGKFREGGEGRDGYDTIEWIAKQSWSNGDVCMMGLSYLGMTQWTAAGEVPPHLRCIAPTSTSASSNDFTHIGGAFNLAYIQWLNVTSARSFQYPTGQGLDWERIYEHRPLLTLDEAMGRRIPLFRELLKKRDTTKDFIAGKRFGKDEYGKIKIPVLHITGWFDSFLVGAMESWDGMMAYSKKDNQYLVIGPWNHDQGFFGGKTKMGEMKFSKDSVMDLVDLHLRFFDHYLKNKTKNLNFPRSRIYITGSNEWRKFDSYPPTASQVKRMFLHSGGNANTTKGDGQLSWTTPAIETTDNFTFDPHNPVPSGSGTNEYRFATHEAKQIPVEERDDILIYTSKVLGKPMDIIGKVVVELYAATDGRDTDFTARLVDVYPDGRTVKLGSPKTGVIRARYRNGLDKEELLKPGKVVKYRILLSDIGHTFLEEHKLRLEVSSSAYPLVNPNQNTGNPIATDMDWRVAKQTIYHSKKYPSSILLPVYSEKRK